MPINNRVCRKLTNERGHVEGGDLPPGVPVRDLLTFMVFCQQVLDGPLHVQDRVGKDSDACGH